jgi:hypothetical protein
MNSVDVLRGAVYGEDSSPYTSMVKKNMLHLTIPVSKSGAVPAKPPKTPFYQVGLCAELLDIRQSIAPNNLKLLDVDGVTKQGEILELDEGMDQLPEAFFETLGKVNNEIETATGFNPDNDSPLAHLFAPDAAVTKPRPSKPSSKPEPNGKVTEQDLERLHLDIDRLEEMGLTVAMINERGITLEQLTGILQS